MKKKYRIYVDPEKDRDIYEKLESIPRPLRGEFIRMAIKRFMEEENEKGKWKKDGEEGKKKPFLDVFG